MRNILPSCFYCGTGKLWQSYKATYLKRSGFIINCYNCSNIFFKSIVNSNEIIEIVPDEDLVELYKDYDCF